MFGLCRDELRAFLQNHRRIDRQQPDQLLAIRPIKVRQRQRAPADEIATADRPAEPNIIRGDGPIGLLTDDDEALLGAQHVHRIGAVWGYITLPQRIPNPLRLGGRYVDLEAGLSPVKLTRNNLIETSPK